MYSNLKGTTKLESHAYVLMKSIYFYNGFVYPPITIHEEYSDPGGIKGRWILKMFVFLSKKCVYTPGT